MWRTRVPGVVVDMNGERAKVTDVGALGDWIRGYFRADVCCLWLGV